MNNEFNSAGENICKYNEGKGEGRSVEELC